MAEFCATWKEPTVGGKRHTVAYKASCGPVCPGPSLQLLPGRTVNRQCVDLAFTCVLPISSYVWVPTYSCRCHIPAFVLSMFCSTGRWVTLSEAMDGVVWVSKIKVLAISHSEVLIANIRALFYDARRHSPTAYKAVHCNLGLFQVPHMTWNATIRKFPETLSPPRHALKCWYKHLCKLQISQYCVCGCVCVCVAAQIWWMRREFRSFLWRSAAASWNISSAFRNFPLGHALRPGCTSQMISIFF